MLVDLLSVLKGISGMLGMGLKRNLGDTPPDRSFAYVECGKTQLDEVIKGMEGAGAPGDPPSPEEPGIEPGGEKEEGLDPVAQAAKDELGG